MTVLGHRCPHCGSRHSIPIVYGPITAELEERVVRGDVVVGGEWRSADEPSRECVDCRWRWRHALRASVLINTLG